MLMDVGEVEAKASACHITAECGNPANRWLRNGVEFYPLRMLRQLDALRRWGTADIGLGVIDGLCRCRV